MRSTPRHRFLVRLVTAAVSVGALLVGPAQPAHPVAAEVFCPAGTNWDNRIQACR